MDDETLKLFFTEMRDWRAGLDQRFDRIDAALAGIRQALAMRKALADLAARVDKLERAG